MLGRQDSSLSSSRRQPSATPPPESHHATAIGCMSGIFHLFSKYQKSNKRLTFGRKQEKRKPLSPKKGKRSEAKEEKTCKELNSDVKQPRSPTLRPEIRRLHAVESPEDSKTSSSLLMKLIGLDDFGAAAANPPASEEDSVTEKRQHLLQALEKCNEDLEALKRIINAVQKAEVRLQPPPPAAVQRNRCLSCDGNAVPLEVKPCVEKCTDEVVGDPNIPAGTTAEVTPQPIGRFSMVLNAAAGGTIMPACKASTCTTAAAEETTFEDYNDHNANDNDDPSITKLLNKYSTEPSVVLVHSSLRRAPSSGSSSSRAMVESVGEVCREIGWGEKREIGMIGLLVQEHLWTELIQDLLQDLNKLSSTTGNNSNKSMQHYSNSSSFLPLHACKRRLCF